MDIEAIKLFPELKRSGFHSSIATTYSVDGAFYDGPVQRRLRHFECLNNILIADASMLSQALAASPETFAVAGQRYAIVPAQVRGCFHPKVLLRLGAHRARLVVTSANVTAAGWGANLEIAGCFEYRGGDPESEAAGPLVRKAYDYLLHWLASVPGESVAFKLRLHRRDSPWLADMAANGSPVPLRDGTAADLLCEHGDGRPGIMHRLVELVDGERVRQLVVVSPYWDENLSALRNLRRALEMPATTVVLNPSVNEFPTAALAKESALRFAAVSDGEDQRFLHAKVFVVMTDKADHVVFGSANCSGAALGTVGSGGTNAEMSVYRRLASGTAVPMLGLDLSREIQPSVFKPPGRDPFVPGAGRILAGQVEITDTMLRWWPVRGIPAEGAAVLVGSDERVMIGSGTVLSAVLGGPLSFPIVVRFRLRDGRLTEPTLVHAPQKLLGSSPGTVDARTLRMFQEVEQGRADLIDLAQRASQLFAHEPERPRGGGGGKSPQPDAVDATDYSTPEEFRAALEVNPGGRLDGLGGRFATRDPTLLQLLRIVMRGIVDVPDPGIERTREREIERDENKRDQAGEKEDGDERSPEEPDGADGGDETAQPPTPPEPAPEKKFYAVEEVERRRRHLMKALTKFDKMLEYLAKDTGPVSENLAAQATFIFSLMSLAVQMPHPLEGGSTRTLMTFDPTNDSRESSFVIRAAQVLRTIWVGHSKALPLAPRMPRWPKHVPPPPDLIIFVAMSRWVMARAHGAAVKGHHKQLQSIISAVAARVFAATAEFAKVDVAEEARLIRQMDASIGFLPVETDDLLARMRHLRTGIAVVLPGNAAPSPPRARAT